ncbi:MAG: aKG-HExxH-type peptide beta-hydroxylase, partial [Streptomyces sp.]|uniref:aKG-HExxH-type peptide beta-hydroxylase n=1 Tax=Streptomyces sp. TaxID=1931 RepID=UPI003D6BB3E9
GGRARIWAARWHAALVLLESADPGRGSEVISLVRSVVPLAGAPGRTVSATLGAAPCGVLTQLPGTALELAAVLVHEVQHSKLAVLADLTPLHQDDGAASGAARYPVAWRADPRPLSAVLQGTYAHLALADLWHRLAARRGATPAARSAARARREEYRGQVAQALAVLRESGELTGAGREFTRGMARHHASLRDRPGGAGPGPGLTGRRHVTAR